MPGLRLTAAISSALGNLDEKACDPLLRALVDAKSLFATRGGACARSATPIKLHCHDGLRCLNAGVSVPTATAGRHHEPKAARDSSGTACESATDRADWPSSQPDETGATSRRTRLKATHYAAATGLPTVAEDSGLEIDALGGAPGVESARFGGGRPPIPKNSTDLRASGRRTGRTRRRGLSALALAERGRIVLRSLRHSRGRLPWRHAAASIRPDLYPPFGARCRGGGSEG
jgi:hypothetical protein